MWYIYIPGYILIVKSTLGHVTKKNIWYNKIYFTNTVWQCMIASYVIGMLYAVLCSIELHYNETSKFFIFWIVL